MQPRPLSLLLLASLSLPALATDTLRQVTLHPKGATIERALTLPAGAREARFSCLSPVMVSDSIQLQGSANMSFGEIRLERKPIEALPECDAGGDLRKQVRELESQRRRLQIEQEAMDASLQYLKQLSGKELPPGAKLPETVEQLRRQIQEQLTRQQALKERMEALEKQLSDAREVLGGQQSYEVLTVPVDAPQGGELRLVYRSEQASWRPQYRAYLDTRSGTLNLERRAEVLQTTGENWTSVPLRLSTELGRTQGELGFLGSWLLDIIPKDEPRRYSAPELRAPSPAPLLAPSVARAAPSPSAKNADALNNSPWRPPVEFSPEVFLGEFATEYVLPGRQRLLSGAAPVLLSLSREAVKAEVYSRIQPQTDSDAFLIAEAVLPSGSWPSGKLQLYRDNSFIGETRLVLSGEKQLDLVFGRDERVRVRRLPEREDKANTGLIGQRQERQVERVYELENRHDKPLPIVMLEASPVARHADIRVEAQFSPEPQPGDWRDQIGIRAWRTSLAAKQTQRFSARYKLSAPADAQVRGWR
jgi:uncharacterized protein (TIGR02231 family)